MRKVKIQTRKSIKNTLISMPVGIPQTFSTKTFKSTTIRDAASKLKKEGYLFLVTEAGLTNKTTVTKIKDKE